MRTIADGLGVIGATACALHCIALPTLLILGATVPTVFLGDESFHLAMLWLVVPSAVIAFSLGCWRHKDRWVLLLGALGAAGMVLSGTVLHETLGEAAEKMATVGSAALLIAAHVRNFRLCRSESCQHVEP
ncbi:MAG: MerC domain-containing protein [Holophagales bacterium]|nr:MerC domain-containing protein [Holophagales bacterium]